MHIKQVAEITGTSIRTLHHYDAIGLLTPKKNNKGYRIYSETDLDKLQVILFYRTLEMPLKEIQILLRSQDSAIDHLKAQRKKLIRKQQHIMHLIQLIDTTIQSKKEGIMMTTEEKFKGINFNDNQYEQEARDKFGDAAVDNSNQKLNQLTNEDKDELAKAWVEMFETFSLLKEKPVEDEAVLKQTENFYHFLNNHFGNYSLDAFYGLGDMYTMDQRFTQNINQYGENLAEFISAAMKHYATINS
ncbi:MerR family transcriptional regulator [Macrococcus animalis]|uniref:MerR family transcriptional regulator n=1 Tax=Macrococcus animalis TaxID=3395467 RepID=UPI0039BE58F5